MIIFYTIPIKSNESMSTEQQSLEAEKIAFDIKALLDAFTPFYDADEFMVRFTLKHCPNSPEKLVDFFKYSDTLPLSNLLDLAYELGFTPMQLAKINSVRN